MSRASVFTRTIAAPRYDRRVRPARITAAVLIIGLSVAFGWWWIHRTDSRPFRIDESMLTGWTLVTTDGTDPWVVGIRPSDALITSLFKEVSRRAGKTLVAPPHPAVPLVLRSEFEEGLQGVYGVDSVTRIAKGAGIDGRSFAPVCLAHRVANTSAGRAEVYFVPFESVPFNQMRVDLLPAQPEQAGVGIYDPATLTPVLIVAASDAAFDRWWPLVFDREHDCEAPLN